MDRLTALTTFRHAVDLGSFAAAARHLGLSPAAVSKNIGELEQHLGTRLLNRTTRKMSLTEAGTTYFERVVAILDDLDDADDVLGSMRRAPSGTLRIAAPMTVALTCFSSAIPRFLECYPDVSIDLHLDDRRVNIVEDGFDIAIRGVDTLEDSSLIARKLLTMRHVLCGAPSYFDANGVPSLPEDLTDHELIQFSLSGHAQRWTFDNGAREAQVPVSARYKVSSSLAVIDALREGFGVSLVPRIYVEEDLDRGSLQTVLDDWAPDETTLYAIYPSRQYLVSKVRVFLDFLADEFAKLEGKSTSNERK